MADYRGHGPKMTNKRHHCTVIDQNVLFIKGHWTNNNCPSKAECISKSDSKEECNITLYTKDPPTEVEISITEPSGSAITHTVCTQTVGAQESLNMHFTAFIFFVFGCLDLDKFKLLNWS